MNSSPASEENKLKSNERDSPSQHFLAADDHNENKLSGLSSTLAIQAALRDQRGESKPWRYIGGLIFYYLFIPFLTNLVLPFKVQYKILKGNKSGMKKKLLVMDTINRWLSFINTLCVDMMLVLMSLAAKGKYFEFAKHCHLYVSLDQVREGLQTTFHVGSKFFASLVGYDLVLMLPLK
ncbi:MAG: hypothetical protein GY821_03225 [Gammaproteobacteria bacterium]|nr:hypothetical protein [Gammaproteobacteria bacterium]